MIHCRPFRSGDEGALDVLLHNNTEGDVRLNCDQIIVAETEHPVGCLVWRPGGIIHELRTGNGLVRRVMADKLVDHAIAKALEREYPLYEAVFLTDSDALAAYAKDLGAIEQIGKRIFTMKVR